MISSFIFLSYHYITTILISIWRLPEIGLPLFIILIFDWDFPYKKPSSVFEVFLRFSYMVFLYGFPIWFSYMVFLWFSYGCPMVFLWFSYGFPMVWGTPMEPPIFGTLMTMEPVIHGITSLTRLAPPEAGARESVTRSK